MGSNIIPSSIDFVDESPLCTTLRKDGVMVSTVEHLLSALEASGVDNCCIEISPSIANDSILEVFPSYSLILVCVFMYLCLIS